MTKLASALALTLALAASASCALGAELEVRLRAAAAAGGDFVRLGDVASIKGERSADAAAMLLGRAPSQGQSRTISAREISLRLEEEGYDARRFEVSGANETLVSAPARQVAAAEKKPEVKPEPKAAVKPAPAADEELKSAACGWLCAALAERLACPVDGVDVRVESARGTNVPAELADVKAAVQWPGDRIRLGRMNIEIKLTAAGQPAGSVHAVADMAVMRPVLTAARELAIGRELTADDVVAGKMRLTDLAGEYPAEASQVVGLVAVKAIPFGAPVDGRMLGRQMLVRRGVPVTMVVEAGGASISETVMARGDGAMNDLVVVERLNGQRRQMAARVVGKATVKVE